MKKLIYLLLLIPFLAHGQADIIVTKPIQGSGANYNKQSQHYANVTFDLNMRLPHDTVFSIHNSKDSVGYMMFNTRIGLAGVYVGGGNWDTLKTAPPQSIPAGIISSLPSIGDN